jgi:alpha-tubulin suppressor-like RCC1 family protein
MQSSGSELILFSHDISSCHYSDSSFSSAVRIGLSPRHEVKDENIDIFHYKLISTVETGIELCRPILTITSYGCLTTINSIEANGSEKYHLAYTTIHTENNIVSTLESFLGSIPSEIEYRPLIGLISCNDLFILFTDHLHHLYRRDTIDRIPNLSTKTRIMSSNISFTKIVCGEDHALLIGKDLAGVNQASKLYTFGCGDRGQLGIEGVHPWVNDLFEVILPEQPTDVCAGVKFSGVVTHPSGTFHTFGWDSFNWPIAASSSSTSSASKGGQELYHTTPIIVEELLGVGRLHSDGTISGIQRCACGPWHVVVLTEDSYDLYGWGWNKFGQLGSQSFELITRPTRLDAFDDLLDDDASSRIMDILCGSRNTIVRSSSGQVFGM